MCFVVLSEIRDLHCKPLQDAFDKANYCSITVVVHAQHEFSKAFEVGASVCGVGIRKVKAVPGPPAEKEPPPPMRYCRTVMTTEAFTSLQPPSTSNPSMQCVKGPAMNCLQSK